MLGLFDTGRNPPIPYVPNDEDYLSHDWELLPLVVG